MNTHSSQASNAPLIIQRRPPAVPVSPPSSQTPIINKPLPPLPKSSPEKKESDIAPQPPQRTRSALKATTSNDHGTSKINNNGLTPTTTNNKTDATNEAAKLVYKTVMMGSVQNINDPQEVKREKSPHNKPIKTDKHTSSILYKGSNVQDIVGAMYNSDLKEGSRPNHEFEMKERNDNDKTATTPTIAPGQFITNVIMSRRSNPSSANIAVNNSDDIYPFILLSGETIVRKDDNEPSATEIIFVMPDNRAIRGRLYITNFRIYFKSDDMYQINQYQSHFIIIDLPLGLINRIEKVGHQSSKTVNFYGIVVNCKNGRRLRFANTQDKGTRKQICETIQRYAFPVSNNMNFFAFDYKKTFTEQNNGWNVYDVRQEYERMGLTQSNDFRYSKINADFKFCETYPRLLVVPKSVSDEDLRLVGEFRSKHRIPVVSWIKYDNKTYRAALLRSSQPLVGLTLKKNEYDEAYLSTFYKLNSNNSLDKLFIVDARPLVNAVANRGAGGGYENEDNYEKCEILFLNIQNIHVMRESLRKIHEMAMPNSMTPNHPGANSNNLAGGGIISSSNSNSNPYDDKNFFLNLENSKWLEHIRFVLNGALKIVRYISQHRASVLVHCSDGWDRTAQLTSLSMLMMDKYYRTLKGFQVLIEKEWLSFGHRFGIRMGHGSDKHSDQDRSPIFLQFIDAVWQILQQNSKVFEFNEKFLLCILQNMYTCQYGTFLYNNEYEREKYEVKTKTISLWSYINNHSSEFKNNAYVEYDDVVEFSSTYCSLQLWTQYYFQYKDIIDDSMNESVITNYNKYRLNQSTSRLANISAANFLAPPQAKLFGQAFFQQMVSQMKSSVRNYSQQEPELIRYRAVTNPET